MEDIDVEKVSQELLNWALKESKQIIDYDIQNWHVGILPTEEIIKTKFKGSIHKSINCHTDTQAHRVFVAFYRKTGRKIGNDEIQWIQEYLWGTHVIVYYRVFDFTQLE